MILIFCNNSDKEAFSLKQEMQKFNQRIKVIIVTDHDLLYGNAITMNKNFDQVSYAINKNGASIPLEKIDVIINRLKELPYEGDDYEDIKREWYLLYNMLIMSVKDKLVNYPEFYSIPYKLKPDSTTKDKSIHTGHKGKYGFFHHILYI